MTYFDEIRHRSILLWRSLFPPAEAGGDGDTPVYIELPAAGDGAPVPAAGEGENSVPLPPEHSGAENGEPGDALAGFDKVRPLSAVSDKTQPSVSGDGEVFSPSPENGAAGDREPHPPAKREAADEDADTPVPDVLERVLRGMETDTAGTLRRQTAEAKRQTLRRRAMARQAAADGESGGGTGGGAGPAAWPARRRDGAAVSLLAAVRRAEQSASAATAPLAAENRAVPAGTVPAAEAAGTADAIDWSLEVERDARRYDGTYETM